MRARAAAILVFLAVLVLAGCLQRLGAGSRQFEDQYRGNLTFHQLADVPPECRMGSCWCMVCKNGTNIFGPLNNLIGGYCYWEKNCTPQTTANLNNRSQNPDFTIRHFMVGQGPSFGDFSVANTYCSDRLSMSVQWLLGSNNSSYTLPDAQRSMCFLSKDVMPVYILYSNGTNINESRARRIGEILGTQGDDFWLGRLSSGPVGPVVVVTEMNFNASQASLVADQVIAIDDTCNGADRALNRIHCFIAVAPKINDLQALDAVMNALSTRGALNRVDLVAYGVDGKYVRGCNGPEVRQQALNFSSYALYNWSKPTIIPYVLFDPGKNDSTNTCTWTESDVVSAYGSFFPFSIQSLQKRGVIGIAPYSFNTSGGAGITNPLNCTDCGVGRTAARLRAWYGGCQVYTNISRSGTSHASGASQIVFGNESGTVCNQNTQFDFLRGFNFAGRDIMQQQLAPIREQAPHIFSCDACLLNNVSRPATDMFPSLQVSGGTPSDLYCKGFPEIDQWASVRNLDPMLVRAFILTESGFDPCSAAKVCRAGYDGPGCFQPGPGKDECYDNAYDEMYDPRGNCTFEIASNAGQAQPDWRWCAVGIMQSLEPPYTFWPASHNPDGSDGQWFEIFDRSGFHTISLDGARSCNRYFNPFIAADSICIGTLKMEGMLRNARAWITSHRSMLNWPATDIDKDNLFAAYITGNMYAGFWGSSGRSADHPRCFSGQSNGECWAHGFSISWPVNATYCQSSDGQADTERCQNGQPRREPPRYCYGYTDFMEYVRDCEVPYLPRQADPGRGKVQAFLYLSNGCPNNFCPDGRRFLQEACKPDETGQVNQQLCWGPNQPKLPSSGSLYMPDAPGTGPSGPTTIPGGSSGPSQSYPNNGSRGYDRSGSDWNTAG